MTDERKDRPRDAKQELAALEAAARPTFWGFLGCELVAAEEGRAAIALQVRPEHLNLAGIVHGGVLASLLDNAMGLVAILACPGDKTVTSGLNVHYLASSSEGLLTCEAALVFRSRRTLTLEGRITDNKGELLVWGSGTFRRVT
ncbi:PaaI family thioesterase [Paenibacillus lycopersici]|uniref:PaaI family thioesterase n=1 Tax=Paenibacillus lycopersici TaxID=2704462 RepID=A0A6C0FT90_9BACL|nr:PaaI family thioesterase [Paenibacillus lycopersici]QHT59232.1 PaaI family thioesterase [Paenibacillus lycopersici]